MAANPYKRDLANRARMILNAGLTERAGILFDSITDEQFADWTTVNETTHPDKRLVCFLYERILKQVLLDMQPDFAVGYADLGQARKTNLADGGWDYLFELPSDFLSLIAQVDEANPNERIEMDRDPQVLFLKNYSHTVVGTDDLVYTCNTDHTSADDSSDGQPPDDDGNTNWTVDSTEELSGAEWAEGVDYEYQATRFLLATNTLSNADGDSAYIKYLAYVQAGRSDQPQYYPESFANAFATRLAAEMALSSKDIDRRELLLKEYESLAKPAAWSAENAFKSQRKHVTVFESRTR